MKMGEEAEPWEGPVEVKECAESGRGSPPPLYLLCDQDRDSDEGQGAEAAPRLPIPGGGAFQRGKGTLRDPWQTGMGTGTLRDPKLQCRPPLAFGVVGTFPSELGLQLAWRGFHSSQAGACLCRAVRSCPWV